MVDSKGVGGKEEKRKKERNEKERNKKTEQERQSKILNDPHTIVKIQSQRSSR